MKLWKLHVVKNEEFYLLRFNNYILDYQIIAIGLEEDIQLYPEISAGKQRFSIRFVDASNLEEKGKQIVEDVPFTLSLYSFW